MHNARINWSACENNFAVIIEIYSKSFSFLTTTAEKRVIWGPEQRL